MKKLILLFAGACMASTAFAQTATIPTTHKVLVMKWTADWCPPCGGSAWTWTNDMIQHAKAGTLKAVVWAIHNSNSNQAPLNVGSMYSSLRTNLDSNVSGIPSFSVGKLNMAQSNISLVEAKVNAMTSTPAEANTGFILKWAPDGKSVEVKATTKFFAAATGTYSVGVYLIEDKVSAKQFNQGTGTYPNSTPVEHHNILRTPATGMTSAFGTQLPGTSFTANQTFDNTFTLPITAGWNSSNITVVTVLWKKVGTQWESANASEVPTFTTGISNVENNIISGIYPNPATDKFNLAVGQSLQNCTVDMFDMTGKKVAQLYNGDVDANAVGLSFARPAGLAPGTYMLNVSSDKGSQSLKLQLQ